MQGQLEVRRLGYAGDRVEGELEIRRVTLVRSERGHVLASISVSGASTESDEGRR